MIIGISGKMGSGKTTLANAIKAQSSYGIRPFAKSLKQACGIVFGLTHEQLYGSLKNTLDPRWGQTPREILQKFGTEVVRSIHPDTWVRQTVDAIGEGDAIIDDVRYPNEADAIRRAGGIVIRTARADRPQSDFDRHVSETALDTYKFDGVFSADHKTLSSTALAVLKMADEAIEKRRAAQARLTGVLEDFRAERGRQDAKWGPAQNHHLVPPDYTAASAIGHAEWFKQRCDFYAAAGHANWTSILLEEVYEAVAEAAKGDAAKLEVELVQVGAVCCKWLENIRAQRVA